MSPAATILIVDDEQPIAAFLAEFLLDEGYTVTVATDGLQALAVLAQLVPDLILLDVMMPRMDGEAVLNHVRTTLSHPVPVIMMSAGVNLKAFLTQGASAVIAKPIYLDQLLTLIGTLVGRRGASH